MNFPNSEQRAIELLEKYQMPITDNVPLKASPSEFEHGGQYGVEIPAINDFKSLKLIIRLLHENDVYCTRFNETHGSFLLSDGEISDMLGLCADSGYGITFGLGPRPEYDVRSTFYRTKFGLELGRQLNNNDAIMHSVAEAVRLTELGCRGLIVYDMGILRILNTLREQGEIPADTVFKVSSHCMVSNPYIAKIYHENGADSITAVHDLSVGMLQEMRRVTPDLVFDVPIDVYLTKGGFIRFYEIAKIVQSSAPVFLKMGASSQSDPYSSITEDVIRKRVKRVAVGLEYLDKMLDQDHRISRDNRNCCLPQMEPVMVNGNGVLNHV